MRRVLLLLLILLSMSGWAERLSLRLDSPKVYTVKQGDTLWDIAALYLDDPWLWPRLWRVNPAVANPHLIYPGDRLLLTLVNGEPQLSRQPGWLSAEPVATLDTARLQPFLSRVLVVAPSALAETPVVESGSRGSLRFVAGDTLYASAPLTPGQDYGVFRHRQSLSHPHSGVVLGEELVLAAAGVADLHGDLQLVHSWLEAGPGEPLYALMTLPAEPLRFPLAPAPRATDLLLVASPGRMREVGPGEQVYLTRSPDLKPGHLLLGVHQPRPGAMLFRGELVVVRCFELVCLALVTSAGHPLRVADRAVSPEAAWPPL